MFEKPMMRAFTMKADAFLEMAKALVATFKKNDTPLFDNTIEVLADGTGKFQVYARSGEYVKAIVMGQPPDATLFVSTRRS